MAHLPHAADLSHHGTLLLLLLQLLRVLLLRVLLLLALPPLPVPGLGNRTRNLQLILFIWRNDRINKNKVSNVEQRCPGGGLVLLLYTKPGGGGSSGADLSHLRDTISLLL